ncbi:MAG: hypothetical protein ALAOOOJD_02545 [bacterium]|nr:hypothetical protein [bacterium]
MERKRQIIMRGPAVIAPELQSLIKITQSRLVGGSRFRFLPRLQIQSGQHGALLCIGNQRHADIEVIDDVEKPLLAFGFGAMRQQQTPNLQMHGFLLFLRNQRVSGLLHTVVQKLINCGGLIAEGSIF